MAALNRAFDGRVAMTIGAVIGAVGAIGVAIGLAIEPDRTLAAYLAAWMTSATAAIGGLAFLLIGYAANARWPAALRRLAEATAGALVPLAILFLPLLILAREVWPWAAPSPTLAHELGHKRAWLAIGPFVVRTIIYFAVWLTAAELLRRWSRRRDVEPCEPVPIGIDALHRERRFAAIMLPMVGVTLTFASFDWLMSLQPMWYSAVFGLYVTTGTLSSGIAVLILLAWSGVRAGALPLSTNHFHALGRLAIAFVALWAYIAFFQAMLIQIANRPDEVTFYIARMTHGWRTVTVLLVILQFALPFPLLIPRRLKHRPRYLGGVAMLLLVAHYVDMWWLVIPTIGTPTPSWTDLAALCAIGGTTVAVAAWRARGAALLPVGDPYLKSGLDYASHI
jgi:hypothetical protein